MASRLHIGSAASTSGRVLTPRCTATRSRSLTLARSATQERLLSATSGLQLKKSLKEWAVTISALGHGEQTILLRKGGIKEPVFKPEAREFLFFPTAFHSKEDLLKPGVAQRYSKEMELDPRKESVLQLGVAAVVTGAWTTSDTRVLEALADMHIWTPAFLEARLKWRGAQPLTVMELRAVRLAAPLQLPVTEELFGCFSWLELPDAPLSQLSLKGAVPAMSDRDFAGRQAALRERLQGVTHQKLWDDL